MGDDKKKKKESPKYTSLYAHKELKNLKTGKVVKSGTVKLKPSSVDEALGGTPSSSHAASLLELVSPKKSKK
tara:strand:- start:968 stop:1183 length:216 start_codon:yes stop_codon:yes gene_type:complete